MVKFSNYFVWLPIIAIFITKSHQALLSMCGKSTNKAMTPTEYAHFSQSIFTSIHFKCGENENYIIH